MATYDPKRTRPAVTVDDDDPAPVEDLLGSAVDELPTEPTEPAEPAAPAAPAAPADAPVEPSPIKVEVSASPFEPAGPPDRRAAVAAAVGVATVALVAALLWWRRRSH